MQQGIAARWGWLVLTDIARNDLYGDAHVSGRTHSQKK